MAAREPTMTSRTGNSRRSSDPRGDAGFTLIELILVMAMLLTVIAVAMPSLSHFFRGRTLDSEARRFLSLTRYGQSRAVSEGVPIVLWIDAKQGRYGLEQEAGYSESDPKAVDLELGKDLSLEADVAAAQSRQFGPMTQSGTLSQLRPTSRNLPVIRFLPDGFIGATSPQGVWIRESENRREDGEVWIALNPSRSNYEIQTNVWRRASR